MVKRGAGGIEVALGEQRDRITGARHTRLPKGKPAAGEGLETAALREVREETGLPVRIAAPLGSVAYRYRDGHGEVSKRVHFFLMELAPGTAGEPDGELDRIFWCPLGAAAERLSFDTERDVIERARAHLGG